MTRRGFTLLETVVALAIAIVVMGAALTANRVVQSNAQLTELTTQQEAILGDTINMLTLTHDTLRQGAQPFSSAFLGLGVNSPLRIAPYRFRQADPLQPTDPVVIKWCTPSNVTCTGLISTAGPTNAQYAMSTALSANGAEVIAMRKTAPVLGEPQLYDFTFLPSTGLVSGTTLFGDSDISLKDWDFYRRQITVTNRSTQYGGYAVTVSVWPMIGGQDRTASTVTRTVIYTDF